MSGQEKTSLGSNLWIPPILLTEKLMVRSESVCAMNDNNYTRSRSDEYNRQKLLYFCLVYISGSLVLQLDAKYTVGNM